MRPIWKGAISFGLVNIPVSLYPATRREELRFHLLRKGDLSPVNNKRVAEKDGREVPWNQVVKGYEYEKGKYVVLQEEDFARVDVEATQKVDIIDFVNLSEVSPIYFHKPYYMAPQKGGEKAYVLLREALKESGKIGIAKVVIKTRQYLAGVKPQGPGLMLELMHFQDEMVDPESVDVPKERTVGRRELQMAQSLIASMSNPWDPEKYHDEYREALKDVIEEKLEDPDRPAAKPAPAPKATKVTDLVEVLRQSLSQASSKKDGGDGDGRHNGHGRSKPKASTSRVTRKREIRPRGMKKPRA